MSTMPRDGVSAGSGHSITAMLLPSWAVKERRVESDMARAWRLGGVDVQGIDAITCATAAVSLRA